MTWWSRVRNAYTVKTLICVASLLAACGGTAQSSHSSPSNTASPRPDSATQNYVALIHNYWITYKTAEGDLDHLSGTSNDPFGADDLPRVCYGYPSPVLPRDLDVVDPAICGRVAAAILPVHEKFLSDLDTSPAPPKFSAEDKSFRAQLPKAIADVKRMISASATANKAAVVQATTLYANDVIPVVTDALDAVDPSFVHN